MKSRINFREIVNLEYGRVQSFRNRNGEKRMMYRSAARIVLWPRIPLSNSRLYTCEYSPPLCVSHASSRDSMRLPCFPCLRRSNGFLISPRDTANHHPASTLSTPPILLSSNRFWSSACLSKRSWSALYLEDEIPRLATVGEFRKFSFSFVLDAFQISFALLLREIIWLFVSGWHL